MEKKSTTYMSGLFCGLFRDFVQRRAIYLPATPFATDPGTGASASSWRKSLRLNA